MYGVSARVAGGRGPYLSPKSLSGGIDCPGDWAWRPCREGVEGKFVSNQSVNLDYILPSTLDVPQQFLMLFHGKVINQKITSPGSTCVRSCDHTKPSLNSSPLGSRSWVRSSKSTPLFLIAGVAQPLAEQLCRRDPLPTYVPTLSDHIPKRHFEVKQLCYILSIEWVLKSGVYPPAPISSIFSLIEFSGSTGTHGPAGEALDQHSGREAFSTAVMAPRLETSAWTPSSSHSRLSRPSPHTPHANKGPCSSQPESRNLGCSPAALVSSHQLGSAPTAALMWPRGKREPSLPCTSSAPTGLSAQSAFHLEMSVGASPTATPALLRCNLATGTAWCLVSTSLP